MLTTTRSLHRDDGFTMIEMVVGMVLAGITLVLVVGVVMGAFDAGERSGVRTKAQRAAVLASEQLNADLRAMRAPQRDAYYTGSPDRLRAILLGGSNPGVLQVHDLLEATPTRVRFFAEIVNQPPPNTVECVTWEVTPSGALHRTVRAYSPSCAGTGAALQQREVMPAAPTSGTVVAAAKAPDPFRYTLLQQPQPNAASPNPAACTTPTLATLPTVLGRDQVTSISMDLRAFVVRAGSHGDQQLRTTASIASRQNIEYRYALGCAA